MSKKKEKKESRLDNRLSIKSIKENPENSLDVLMRKDF